MKLKTLPSMREKKRYILFTVHSDGPVEYHNLKSAIMDSLLEFLGERGFSQANIRLIKNLCKPPKGVIQTNPKHVDSVKTSLALIHQIGEEKVAFQTLRVSGTIKALFSKKSAQKNTKKATKER